MKPIVIINFKTYKLGEKALKLAKAIERYDKNIIVGVQASHLREIAKKTKLKIFAEHVDYFEPGRHTGYIIPEAVKKDGAKGTFLNHSEHRLDFKIIKKTVKRCKKIGLKTAVFVTSLKEAKKIKRLKPDYLIIEPPELVAGKISVSKAKPELISKIAKKLKYAFIVGAGVKNKQDVEIAMKLGASGIAVSSAITKAKDVKKALKRLFE
ncbi:MAG: triose-phosphate isomerase [Nanoarchaeota archaeon]|nr:triose-phosphate isomerase [Nanoarchaeota archaeon]